MLQQYPTVRKKMPFQLNRFSSRLTEFCSFHNLYSPVAGARLGNLKGKGVTVSKKKDNEESFRARTILAMADEMKAMKEAVERNCIMFAALAASIGVHVQF